MGRANRFALGLMGSVVLGGCLSSTPTLDTPPLPGLPDADLEGDSGIPGLLDAAIPDAAPAPPIAEAGAFGPHSGFALAPGAVRASSTKHVLITTTGQNPGGTPALRSTNHTLLGGSVGGTQSP